MDALYRIDSQDSCGRYIDVILRGTGMPEGDELTEIMRADGWCLTNASGPGYQEVSGGYVWGTKFRYRPKD